MDLRLYVPTEEVSKIVDSSESYRQRGASLINSAASGEEVLANKVLKFLKTFKGTDPFDPEYGSTFINTSNISTSYYPIFCINLQNDVSRCEYYIKETERNSTTENLDKLDRIIVRKVYYDPALLPNRIDIFLEIITVSGKKVEITIDQKID